MNWLVENALPIWTGGAVALTMALVVYQIRRTNKSLLAMVVVVGVTSALLAAEWLIETPREAVERTLYELADTVETNDVAGTLRFISPKALPNANQMRTDVESMMPLVHIEMANIMGSPEIDIDESRQPQASVKFRGVLQATVKRGATKGAYSDKFVAGFERDGKRWLLTDFMSATKANEPQKEWRRVLGR